MLNLAAFRYRNVLAADGGPIERLTSGETSVLGVRWFSANAYLRADCAPGRSARVVWGSADGSGVDLSPLVARYKAVSEAMERWAHHVLHRAPEGRAFGFDLDPSSNGMAAFPGLFARQARGAALEEAAERFNLLHWWEGRLRAVAQASPYPGIEAWAIESEAPGVTVLLHRRSEHGFHAYGHSAARTFAGACAKAVAELERHETAVRLWAVARAGRLQAVEETAHVIDRRPVFFASEEGYALFRERIEGGVPGAPARPKLIFDGEVPGPWQRYASVWRVVFEPPSRRFVSRELRYFMW
jgi:hypothetical protein